MQEDKLDKKIAKHKTTLKDVLILQVVFILFSTFHIAAKIASESFTAYDTVLEGILTFRFAFWVSIVVFILGVYAIIWQQIIKRFDLSIAYANKGTTMFWGLVWGAILFNEEITPAKIIGVIIVFIGIVIMNREAIK